MPSLPLLARYRPGIDQRRRCSGNEPENISAQPHGVSADLVFEQSPARHCGWARVKVAVTLTRPAVDNASIRQASRRTCSDCTAPTQASQSATARSRIPPVPFSLIGVGAQRLVRRLCPECRKPYAPDPAQLRILGFPPSDGTLYAAQGCAACMHSGYRGRTGIYELVMVDDDFRRLIHDRASEQRLREHVIGRGMRTLREDGMR